GTTSSSSSVVSSKTVHPHARGDDPDNELTLDAPHGSPPRPWGRRARPHGALPPARFTPTPVGTTPVNRSVAFRPSVHPHARGDDAAISARILSSTVHPHARGDDRLLASRLN